MISSWRRKRAAKHGNKKQDFLEEHSNMELTVPDHFRCPISLEMMKDPVTLSTGRTYDRESIETWIEAGNHTCPVTAQVLKSLEPIPNHTIRKMIQEWCVDNNSYGIERIPTPRVPVSSHQISEILLKVGAAREKGDREGVQELVMKIKALGKESERNKRCIVRNGAGKALSATFESFSRDLLNENGAVLEELLSALTIMQPFDQETKSYLGSTWSLRCMVWILRHGDLAGRRNAVLVLKEILSSDHGKIDEFSQIEGGIEAMVKVVKEPICPTTTKASLLAIYHMVSASSPTKNKVISRFIDMGLVSMLLEMLVDCDKSICEKALAVLDGICGCDEGRDKAYDNSLTMPVLVKKILRVSDLATEFSVSILWKLSKNQKREGGGVVVEALQVGAFQKLLLLLQVGSSERTKEKASDLLKLLNLHRDKLECIDSMDFKNLKRPF